MVIVGNITPIKTAVQYILLNLKTVNIADYPNSIK